MDIKNKKLKNFIGEYMEVQEFKKLYFTEWLDISEKEDQAIYMINDLLNLPKSNLQEYFTSGTIETMYSYSNVFYSMFTIIEELYYTNLDIGIDILEKNFLNIHKIFTFYLELIQESLYTEV